ncbi:MAG: hypothetical protein K0U37_04460 [Gammaproteobacteria bacterium]|nr:hypothetical protein [Gammaproteobacteria bacterium]
MIIIDKSDAWELHSFIARQTSLVYEAFNKVILTKEQQAEKEATLTDEQEAIFVVFNERFKTFCDECREVFKDVSVGIYVMEECFNVALDQWCDSFDKYPELKAHPEWNFALIKEGIKLSMTDYFEGVVKRAEAPEEQGRQQVRNSAREMKAKGQKEIEKTTTDLLKKLCIPKSQFNQQHQSAHTLFHNNKAEYLFSTMKAEYGLLKIKGETEALYRSRMEFKFAMLPGTQSDVIEAKKLIRFLDEHKKNLDALIVFKGRLESAFQLYVNEDAPTKKTQEAFRKAVEEATDECVGRYQKEVAPGILDYIKAACLALVGVLIGIVTFPVVLASSNYRNYLKNTFFAGVSSKMVDTPECDTIKNAMKDFEIPVPQ